MPEANETARRCQRKAGVGDGSTLSQYRAFRFVWSVLEAPDRWRFVGKLFSGLAIGLLCVIPPLLVRMLLDSVLPRRDASGLVEVVAIGAIVYLLLAVAGVADQWLQSQITEGLGLALRKRFFDKTLRLPFAFFVHSRSGSLASRLTVDVRTAQRIVQNGGSVATSAVGFAMTFGIMVWLSPRVSLLVLVIVPFVVVADRWFAARIAAQSERQLGANAAMTSFVVERVNAGGALFIRTSGDPFSEAAGFAERSRAVWDYGIRSAVLNRAYYGVLAITTGFGILAVLYAGGSQAISGELQLGTLVALAQYAGQSYQPVTHIARSRMQILNASVAISRIKDFLDTPEQARSTRPTAQPFPATDGHSGPAPDIEFHAVWFRYPDVQTTSGTDGDVLPAITPGITPWILRGVSFRVQAGEKIAIVGESGAGKTSIGYLLAGLFRANEGTIRLGGVDLTTMPPPSLRRCVGLVTQEAFLFSGTLIENIRHGRAQATDEDVIEACEVAGIHETVEALPRGYQTVVGERGYRLSGGQKQRVSLARALLCRCPIILLDEATSHLDAGMDERIQCDLMRDMPGRILIVIAHRLSTISHADQIFVLSDGAIIERGRHEDLTAADGYYASLFRIQQRQVGRTSRPATWEYTEERSTYDRAIPGSGRGAGT